MLRNKLAFAMAGLVGVSLAVGGGAGYWFAHKSEKHNRTVRRRQLRFCIGTIP